MATPAMNVATKLAESPRRLPRAFWRLRGHSPSLATSGHFTEAMAAQINADFRDHLARRRKRHVRGWHSAIRRTQSLAQKMMSQSRETIVVATARKLPTPATAVTAAPLSKISKLVTRHPADVKALVAADLHVIEAR